MQTHRYRLTRLKSVGMVCVLVMSGLLALTRPAKAQGFSPSVFLPNEIVSGNTYSEWAAKWNRWFISIPASINPSLDTSGKFCDESQKGSVFFLAGSGVGTVKRSCTVPCRKPLFFPLITAECSSVEPNPFFGATPADRLICAQQLVDLVEIASLETKIDGVAVTSLNRFRVAGPDTSFRMSPDDNILGVSASSGFSTADGYWLMLKPLSPGSHTLHFASTLDGFSQNVTYDLTVRRNTSSSPGACSAQ